MPKRKEKQEKATKKQRRKQEEIIEIQEENEQENEGEELNEGEQTDEADLRGLSDERPLFSSPVTPERAIGLEADDMDTLYNIKAELQKQGVDLQGEIKFIICKKDDTGRYPHLKTYEARMPDFDLLGKQFGGGDYQVKIYGNGRYLMSKLFSISKESYPVGQSTAGQVAQAVAPAVNINNPVSAGLELMLKTVMEQNNSLLQSVINKPEKKENLLDIIKTVKELMPPPAPAQAIPYEMILGMATQMFQAGISLKERIEEKESDEGIGDVLLNMVKDFSKNLPMLMQGMGGNKNFFDQNSAPTPPAQVTSGQQGAPAQVTAGQPQAQPQGKLTPQQLLLLLKDYFDDVILAFESDTFVHTYHLAEKVYKIARYKPLSALVKSISNEQIIGILSQYGLAKRLSDTDTLKDEATFKEFVTQIIDIIRDFDIISLNDEGEIIKAERKTQPQETVNDNAGQQPEPVADTGDNSTKPAEPESEPVNKQSDGV